MPKPTVGAELGLTLRLFKDKQTFEMFKPDLEIRDVTVNVTGTVEEQLEACIVALRKVYDTVCKEMQKVLSEQYGQIEKELKSAVGSKSGS